MLTDAALRNAKPGPKLRKLSDGGGLQLWIHPRGYRLWRFAYRFNGKQKVLALGSYPDVSLAEARKGRDAAKELLRNGKDPSVERRLGRVTKRVAAANTFRAVADELLVRKRSEGKAKRILEKTKWLLDIASADLGNRPIADISAAEIYRCCAPLNGAGSSKQHIDCARSSAKFSVSRSQPHGGSTIPQSRCVAACFPRRSSTEQPFSIPSSSADSFGPWTALQANPKRKQLCNCCRWYSPGLVSLRAPNGLNSILIERCGGYLHAMTRCGGAWTVPLSEQAVAILRGLHSITGHRRLVFPGARSPERPISENTLNAAIRRLGYGADEVVAHGFRSTASTLLNKSRLWSKDAIEKSLGHIEKDAVRRAYNRSHYWEERVRMAQWWGNYLDGLKGGDAQQSAKIIPLWH